MAVWDSASIEANRALSARRQPIPVQTSDVEPDVRNKWHPAATLGFILVSCVLLWGGIFAAFRLLF